jgi:hypothetical protein
LSASMQALISGAHDAACICLPYLAMTGMPGLGRRMLTVPRSRRRTGARSRRRPRRGTCMSLTTESLRPCLAKRGITTPGEFPRRPCDFSAAYSPNNPIRHERHPVPLCCRRWRTSKREYVVSLCRNARSARGAPDAFSPRSSHRAHTMFTSDSRSGNPERGAGATYMLHGLAREGRPRIRAGECLRELTSHFLFQPIASRALRPQHAPALRSGSG